MQQKASVDRSRAAKAAKTETIEEAKRKFEQAIKEFPIYPCTCCHRLMYKRTVVLLNMSKYQNTPTDILDDVFALKYRVTCKTDNKEYICTTCDGALKRGNMPVQAKANGMALDDVPDELQGLNELEIMLISKRIPFMKIVNLPRGKQKCIKGPCVNVPTNLDKICTLLPRAPHEAHIVAVQLKRRLEYKSHYLYKYVRPQRVMDALVWLKEHNPLYHDVDIDPHWEDLWRLEEMWETINVEADPEVQDLDIGLIVRHGRITGIIITVERWKDVEDVDMEDVMESVTLMFPELQVSKRPYVPRVLKRIK